MDNLNKLARKELVFGLPNLDFEMNWLCDLCQKRKQVNTSFNSKLFLQIYLYRFYTDLFCQSKTMTFGVNYYELVVVDDYSCYN